MANSFSVEVCVAGNWGDAQPACIKRMLATLDSDPTFLGTVYEAVRQKTTDGVAVQYPKRELFEPTDAVPPAVLAILMPRTVDTSDVTDGFSKRLSKIMRVCPVILLAHERPAYEAARIILALKRKFNFASWQQVLDCDVSDPPKAEVHSTWPAEASPPTKTVKASELADDLKGSLVQAQLSEKFTKITSGTLQISLDEAWCFAGKPARSARPRSVKQADPHDAARARLNGIVVNWLKASSRDVVWHSVQSGTPQLHPTLEALRESAGRVRFRPASDDTWFDRINRLSAHDVVELNTAIEDVWEGSELEAAKSSRRSEGLEAYLALIDGQCAALEINPPPDPEKFAAELAGDVDRALSNAIESLSANLNTRIKYGFAARNIVNRLGSRLVLIEEKFRFVMPGPKPFDHTAKLEIHPDGKYKISERLSVVMDGICRAQSEILRMYWLRVVRPSVFVAMNKRIQLNRGITSRLTNFNIDQTGFDGLDPDTIKEQMKWPRDHEITKLFNLNFYLKEIMKMVRLFGRFAGLALLVGVGFKFADLSGYLQDLERITCKDQASPMFCVLRTALGENSAVIYLTTLVIAVMLLMTVTPSLFKLFGLRAEVRAKIGLATVPCVETKLSELAGSWKKHLEMKKSRFVEELKGQIAAQLTDPVAQIASRQYGAMAHVLTDKEVASQAVKSVATDLKKSAAELKSQEDVLKRLSKELVKQ